MTTTTTQRPDTIRLADALKRRTPFLDGSSTIDHAEKELRRQHAEIDRLTDAYCGAREDLAIWKRRALEAEEKLRAESAVSSRLVSELNAENGPTHMGEPVQQRQPLTPLTPGQCVDIADVASKMELSDNFLSDICKIVEMVEVAHGIGEKT